jgi:hypothetical protein
MNTDKQALEKLMLAQKRGHPRAAFFLVFGADHAVPPCAQR